MQDFIRRYGDVRSKRAFVGVFSIDMLPRHLPKLPILLILNTHTKNLPGQHWKAVYINQFRRGEVFDSLALPVSTTLLRWLNQHTKSWTRNQLTIQNPLSATCGAFVTHYILTRMKCRNMRQYFNLFSYDLSFNDRLMRAFVKNLK